MTGGQAAFSAARWQALCQRLALPPTQAARFDDLARAHAQAPRHYHTAQHIGECLTLLDGVARQLHDAPLVELAIWLHDAVYDPRATDNEAQSAELALTWFASSLEPARLQTLQRWILATRQHALAPDERDLQALLDIDLAILAAPPARFAEYEAQVRLEYAHVPQRVFQSKRRQVLQTMLDRPRLYGHPAFAHLEAPARANLKASVE